MKRNKMRSALAGAALAGLVLSGVVPASAAQPAHVAMASVKKSTPSIKISAIKSAESVSKIYAGNKIRVSGKTSSKLSGQKVQLQVRIGKKWVKQGSTIKVSKSGTYAFTVKAPTAGRSTYRVHSTGTAKLRAAYSKSVGVSIAKKSAPALKVSSIKDTTGGSSVYLGNTLKVSGTVSKSLAKKKVSLQALNGKKWSAVGTPATVTSKGAVGFKVKPAKTGKATYRLRSTSTASLSAAYSKAASVNVINKQSPALKLNSITKTAGTGAKVVGDSLTFKGTTNKSLAGKKVSLQRKSSRTWVDAKASGTVSSAGTFSFSAKAVGLGSTEHRVVSSATGSVKGGSSPAKNADLYKWFDVAPRTVVDFDYINETMQIDGRDYPNSLGEYSSGGVDTGHIRALYVLEGKCETFRATIGLNDSGSNRESVQKFSVGVSAGSGSADITKFEESVGYGKAKPVVVDVSGDSEMFLDIQNNSSKGGRAVWGKPQLLCTEGDF